MSQYLCLLSFVFLNSENDGFFSPQAMKKPLVIDMQQLSILKETVVIVVEVRRLCISIHLCHISQLLPWAKYSASRSISASELCNMDPSGLLWQVSVGNGRGHFSGAQQVLGLWSQFFHCSELPTPVGFSCLPRCWVSGRRWSCRARILPSEFSKAFATSGNKRYVLARTIGQCL